jgi:hypothetical protein
VGRSSGEEVGLGFRFRKNCIWISELGIIQELRLVYSYADLV